jgi:catechol-2,3-dioxygenase
MAVSPVRLNHAVLFVADVDRAARFYVDVFGMEIVFQEPGLNGAFLRLPRSGNHHDLGLFGIEGAIPQPRRSVGLYHLAWQLDTVDELVEFRRVLLDSGAYTGESSHGATKSLYGVDPDGNQFEVMWMLPRSEWGTYERAAVVERLHLAKEFETWSGTRTAGDLVHDDPRATTLDQQR